MTRQDFIIRLRYGLRGLPPGTIADIVADYETHFAEAQGAGRDEAAVAAALGDPGRLARELRAEAGLRRWETERNPSTAMGALFALLGLGAIDLFFLMPIVLSIAGTLFGFSVAAIVLFCVGSVVMVAGPVVVHAAPFAALMLSGLGMIASAASLGALTAIAGIGCANALVWYGRLHLRLLRPAIETQGIAA